MRKLLVITLATISMISCYVLPSGYQRVISTETAAATVTPTPQPPTPEAAATDTSAGGNYEKPTPDATPYAPPPQFNPTPENVVPIGGH